MSVRLSARAASSGVGGLICRNARRVTKKVGGRRRNTRYKQNIQPRKIFNTHIHACFLQAQIDKYERSVHHAGQKAQGQPTPIPPPHPRHPQKDGSRTISEQTLDSSKGPRYVHRAPNTLKKTPSICTRVLSSLMTGDKISYSSDIFFCWFSVSICYVHPLSRLGNDVRLPSLAALDHGRPRLLVCRVGKASAYAGPGLDNNTEALLRQHAHRVRALPHPGERKKVASNELHSKTQNV